MQEYNHELTLFGYSDIEISDKDKNFFTTYSKYYSLFLNISRFFDNSPFYIKFILSLTNIIFSYLWVNIVILFRNFYIGYE